MLRYGVGYPNLYAESSNKNANAFNCIQRGHQNSLEGYAMFLSLLLSSGLKVGLRDLSAVLIDQKRSKQDASL